MKKFVQTKKTTCLILISIILIFSSLTSSVKANQDLLFLGNEHIEPLVYKENNTAKGLVVDIINGLNDKIDYNINVEAVDWDIAQKQVLSGKADALLQINPNAQRERFYDFSTELLESEFSIFKKTGDTSINDVDDLQNKKIGVELAGYAYSLLERYNDIDIVLIPDCISGFAMMESGSIDALVADRWIGEYALTKSNFREIEVVEKPIERNSSSIAVKKGNDELLALINSGLKEMKDDGSMDKILKQWSGKNIVYFTEDEIKRNIYYIVFGILTIIILFIVLYVKRLRKINRQLESMVTERTRELYKANKRLEELAILDGLTNIFNRRYFDNALQKAWEISFREKQALSLILLDIDHFKKCNDTYGHLTGDCYLKFLANILEDSIKRPGDLVARFGGEEFVIMLFNTPEEGAFIFAEQIRRKIASEIAICEGKKINCTVSLGVATLIPAKDLSPVDLIKQADQAMYKAKSNGRNQVIMANKAI